MNIRLMQYEDLKAVTRIWNEAVEAGNCFMDEVFITEDELWTLLSNQSEVVVVEKSGNIIGFHFIHPNLIGRCNHIANAAYAVAENNRGQGIGKTLVEDSIARSKKLGFNGMQFNAVVSCNSSAIALYIKLGFSIIGTIKKGFRLKDNTFTDMLIFYNYWGEQE